MSAHRDSARAAAGRGAFAGGGDAALAARSAQETAAGNVATRQVRADVARFFIDLRRTIGASAPDVARQLKTNAAVIAALERADVSALPPWTETHRIVMGYTAWAGIDGRPVLAALGILAKEAQQLRQVARQAAAVRPAVTASSERLRLMQLAIAEGARRLPREALNQARERPVRTFYALSVPMLLVLLSLNANASGTLFSALPRPIKSAAAAVQDMLAVSFAPRREGLVWIEVRDPRSRRSDKVREEDK